MYQRYWIAERFYLRSLCHSFVCYRQGCFVATQVIRNGTCEKGRAFSNSGVLVLSRQAGEPGFEPGLTGSEPVVLPLHHSPEFAFGPENAYLYVVPVFVPVDVIMATVGHLVSSANHQ